MNDIKFLVGPLEELADELEAYVKKLYVIRGMIKKNEEDDELESDYAEALEIKGMWDSMKDIPL